MKLVKKWAKSSQMTGLCLQPLMKFIKSIEIWNPIHDDLLNSHSRCRYLLGRQKKKSRTKMFRFNHWEKAQCFTSCCITGWNWTFNRSKLRFVTNVDVLFFKNKIQNPLDWVLKHCFWIKSYRPRSFQKKETHFNYGESYFCYRAPCITCPTIVTNLLKGIKLSVH